MTLSTERPPPTRRLAINYQWVIVVAAATISFLGTGIFTYSRGVFMPHLADAFGGQRFDIALGFSIEMTVGALIAPFLGRYLDRGSIRRVLFAGIAIAALGYLCLSRIDTLLQFYLVLGVMFGFGMPCLGGFTWQKLVVNWFRARRGLALSFAVLGASLAGVAMPPVATFLVGEVGWQTTYLILGAVTVIVLVPTVAFVVRDAPTAAEAPDSGGSLDGPALGTRQILAEPSFWAIAVVFGVMLCVLGAVMLHLYGHLLDRGLSEYQAATVLSVIAGFSAFGKPFIGWLADRIGGRVSIWLALGLQCVAMILMAETHSFSTALLGAAIYGVGYAGLLPLRSFALAATVGQRAFGSASGLLRPAMWPLQVSASPLAGLIYDRTGSYETAFHLLAGFVLVAAVASLFIRGREDSPQAAAAT